MPRQELSIFLRLNKRFSNMTHRSRVASEDTAHVSRRYLLRFLFILYLISHKSPDCLNSETMATPFGEMLWEGEEVEVVSG